METASHHQIDWYLCFFMEDRGCDCDPASSSRNIKDSSISSSSSLLQSFKLHTLYHCITLLALPIPNTKTQQPTYTFTFTSTSHHVKRPCLSVSVWSLCHKYRIRTLANLSYSAYSGGTSSQIILYGQLGILTLQSRSWYLHDPEMAHSWRIQGCGMFAQTSLCFASSPDNL